MQALKNEIKQKAIFMSLINIKETIKNIQDSADAEVMVIFCEEDMKRLSKSRNIAAHNSQAMDLNIVLFQKKKMSKKRILKPLEVLIIFLFVCILSCIIFITFFYLTSPPKA